MNDTGILALVVLAQFHQIAVDQERIRHEFGNPGTPFTPEDILRTARILGFRARKVDASLDRLNSFFMDEPYGTLEKYNQLINQSKNMHNEA